MVDVGQPPHAVLALWLPAAVAAHLYVALFLCQLLRVARPQLWSRLLCWRSSQKQAIEECTAPGHPLAEVAAGSSSATGIALLLQSDKVAPVSLSWDRICCTYTVHGCKKTVLQDISGKVEAGQLAALMGPSGAGKSTLLDILAGRQTTGALSGVVALNGVRCKKLGRSGGPAAYVPQEVLFVPSMTVEETAAYHAALTLPTSSIGQRKERIHIVLQEIGLAHVASSLVGGMLPGGILLRGLSGGERRRLAIATVLMAGPSLMFLDEPTSGLDSFAAWNVMRTLHQLAHAGGHTVVASLHQPRAAIWAMCDQVVVLAKGRLMYCGPRTAMVPWFDQHLGYTFDPDVQGLPADWVMDLVNIDFQTSAAAGGVPYDSMPMDAETPSTTSNSSSDQGSSREAVLHRTMTSMQELQHAADLFQQHWKQQQEEEREPEKGWQYGCADEGCQEPCNSKDVCESSSKDQYQDTHPAAGTMQLAQHCQPSVTIQPTTVAKPSTTSALKRANSAAINTSSNGDAKGGRGLMTGAGAALRRSLTAVTELVAADSARPRCCWWQQLRVVMWRELLSMGRNPVDIAGRMLIFTWVGLSFGCLFYNLGPSFQDLQNKVNLLFVTVLALLLLPYVAISLFLADKQYFIADTNAGLLSPSAYYVAKLVVSTPLVLLNVAVLVLVLYGLVGLRLTVGVFFAYLAACALMYLISAQVVAACTILTPNQDLAFMLCVAWTTLNIMFANIFVRYIDIRFKWLAALRWLAASGYVFEVAVQTQLGGEVFACSRQTLEGGFLDLLQQLFPNTPAFQKQLVTASFEAGIGSCVVDASGVAGYYRAYSSIWVCFGALLVYLLVLHGISYLGLCLASKRGRR